LKPEEMEAPPLEIGPGASTLPWKKMNSHSLAKAPTKPAEVAAPALLIPDPLDYEASADVPSRAATSQIGSAEAAPAAAEKPNEPVLAAPAQSTPRLAAEKLQVRHIFRESGEEPQQGKQSIGNLLVVIEALNATDEPADGTGEASLMVIRNNTPGRRPSNPADFSVVNRWDFTPDETKAAWQSSQLGDGLHLELPLGETKLPDGELELWARLVCPDGRKLLTRFPFDPTQLASIDDATEKAALASAEEPAARPIPAPENAEVAPASNATTNQEPPPSWHASSVNLDPNRAEGYATTAGSSSGGWTKRPVGEPRIASVSGESSTTDRKPTWKRSATAQAVGGAPQAWAPER
jgi:hypothetical protein